MRVFRPFLKNNPIVIFKICLPANQFETTFIPVQSAHVVLKKLPFQIVVIWQRDQNQQCQRLGWDGALNGKPRRYHDGVKIPMVSPHFSALGVIRRMCHTLTENQTSWIGHMLPNHQSGKGLSL